MAVTNQIKSVSRKSIFAVGGTEAASEVAFRCLMQLRGGIDVFTLQL